MSPPIPDALVLVARPTPSGVDRRSLAELAEAVADRTQAVVRIAHLDQADPSLAEVLDELAIAGCARVRLVPLGVPADRYLRVWTSRAVAHWRHDRGSSLEIDLSGELTGYVADVVAALAAGVGDPVTTSPRAFRSPAWSHLEEPERHLFVCRGPRCTVYGAGGTHRVLADAVQGTDTQVTPTGCLGPCNLGPIVIEHPPGTWHRQVNEDRAAMIGNRTTAVVAAPARL